MKASTAWILLVIAASGAAYWFVTRDRLHYPPPEVAALQLTRGDAAMSPTCLTLDTVLRANGLTDNIWTSRVKDEWTLRVESGRHSWRTYTFHVEGNRLIPDVVASSDDLPQVGAKEAIDEWIAKIHTPVTETCKPAGA